MVGGERVMKVGDGGKENGVEGRRNLSAHDTCKSVSTHTHTHTTHPSSLPPSHTTQGKVLLPLPSISVLAEAASSADHRATVVHVLESSVVAWMRQIKVIHLTPPTHKLLVEKLRYNITSLQMALHFDPSSSILKSHGKYAGPMAEIEVRAERTACLPCIHWKLFTETKTKENKITHSIILCKPFVETLPDMNVSPSVSTSREMRWSLFWSSV